MLLYLLRVVIFFTLTTCLLVQANFPSPQQPPDITTIYVDISSMSDADIVRDLMAAKGDLVCGAHPLQAILDKIEGKLEHDEVVKLLSSIRFKAARLWKAYEHALRKYTTCRLRANGGTLG